MRTFTRCRQDKWRTLMAGGLKVFLMLFLLSFITTASFGQAASSPCTAHRWNSGEAWSKNSTTGLWTGIPATGQTQPQGVVGCASAAATESGLEAYKGIYNPSDFTIDVSAGDCFNMNDNTFGNSLAGPEPGENIVWFNFDIRPLAGTYQFQVVSNQPVGWALYYVDPADARPTASDPGPTYPGTPTGLSGNCSNLKPANIILSGVSHGNCGLQGNGWSTITVPSFKKPTNYYLAMWLAPTGTGDGKSTFPGSMNLVYKSRYGCGGATCTLEFLEKTFTCADNGYTVCGKFGGSAGRWVVQDNAIVKATSYTITTYKSDETTVVSTNTYGALDGSQKVTLGTVPDGAVFAKICATYATGNDYNISLVPDGTYSGGSDYITCGDGAGFSGSATELSKPTVDGAPNSQVLSLATGNVAHLTASTTGGTPPYSYVWTQLTADPTHTTLTYNGTTGAATFTMTSLPDPLPLNYQFKVVVTDAKGCTSEETVEVIPDGTLEPCGIYGPPSACPGTTGLVYTYGDGTTSTPYTLNTANFSYTWSVTGNGTPTTSLTNTSAVTVSATTAGSFIVKMTIHNTTGILGDRTCQYVVTVNETPAAPTLGKVDPTCAVGTGCVTITSSTTGLTFSLDGSATYVAYPANGWCGLAPGSHSVTAKNAAGCVSAPASITINSQPPCAAYCSYTQGFWGNKNGAKLLPSLLGSSITIGRLGHSIYIPAGNTSASKINKVMPGGSTPTVLRAGDCNINTSCFNVYLTKQGKINNVLLSQTITLSLSVRLANNPLNSFSIQSGCIITTGGSFQMNQKVVDYLTYNGATATVADLLDLANDLLGAALKPGDNLGSQANPRIVPSYSDVTNAIDAINNAFDGCRGFNGYQTCVTNLVTTTTLTRISTGIADANIANQVKVRANPNPFNDVVRFTIKSTLSGQGSLEVFNTLGQKMQTVYQGYVRAGGEQLIEYRVPLASRQNLIYVFTINGQRVTGKLLNVRE